LSIGTVEPGNIVDKSAWSKETMKIKNHSLYLILTEEFCNGKNLLTIAKEAIDAGIDILQMREKHKSKEELIELGKKMSALCKKKGVIFIVNDRADVAWEVGADGVHLGQEDMQKHPISDVRKVIGRKMIGLSTHSILQVKEANDMDIDYIAYGPIFATKTKDYHLGTAGIEDAVNTAKKPLIFIGGIDEVNAKEIVSKGGKNIAAIRAIAQSKDIGAAISRFKEVLI